MLHPLISFDSHALFLGTLPSFQLGTEYFKNRGFPNVSLSTADGALEASPQVSGRWNQMVQR